MTKTQKPTNAYYFRGAKNPILANNLPEAFAAFRAKYGATGAILEDIRTLEEV